MDEYDQIKKSSLKFKGEKKKKKKKDCSRNDNPPTNDCKETDIHASHLDERIEDSESHGGWWKVTKYDQIRDSIAIEFLPHCYAKALSNGRIVLGSPHTPGDGPDEEEIFTAIKVGVGQLAIKSGFGRYLAVDSRDRLKGVSEAVGELETFLPVFEDEKLALCARNECFISPDSTSESQIIVSRADRVGPNEILNIRVNHDPLVLEKRSRESSSHPKDLGTVIEAELNLLRKTKGVELDAEKERLKKAKLGGQLHEALLDTRVKHKSDKYCK